MSIFKKAAIIGFICTTVPVSAGWGDWEDTFLGCYEKPVNSEPWDFLASADYTRFSDSEIVDVPIIPVRHIASYSANRLLYGEGDEPTIDYEEHTISQHPYPFLATCTYIDDSIEYCAGLLVHGSGAADTDYLLSYPFSIPDDPEDDMAWFTGEDELLPLDENNLIVSCDVVGDDSGNVHLVTAESPWIDPAHGISPDWTTELYYWRWHIDDTNNMGWNIEEEQLTSDPLSIHRNPDMACDSEGNVHIVYSFNDDAGTSDYGIGYCRITFDAYGDISSINNSPIVSDGTGVLCDSPDITVDDNDNLHVVFQHDGGASNNWNVYYTTKQPQSGWSTPVLVPAPASSFYCWEPSIAVCHDYVHVVYSAAIPSTQGGVYTTGNERIYYTNKALVAQIFSSPEVLSDLPYHDYGWSWSTVFQGDGYANWNHNPCVIAGDDEISVVWEGQGVQYAQGVAPLTRRCCWEDE
jgi:hypothetical protein